MGASGSCEQHRHAEAIPRQTAPPECSGGLDVHRGLRHACADPSRAWPQEHPDWLQNWESLGLTDDAEGEEAGKVGQWATNEDLAARLANLDLGSGFT